MSAPRAERLHTSRGRLRVRIEDARRDPELLDVAAKALLDHPQVHETYVNRRTRSLLILHEGPSAPIEAHARERALFDVEAKPRSAPARAERAVTLVLRALFDKERGQRHTAVAIVGLLTGALIQIRRGAYLPAGESLISQAVKLYLRLAESEPVDVAADE